MEEIKRLTNKKGKFSKAEIDFLIEEGAKLGIMPPKRTGCVNCWRDMAIEIYLAMRPRRKGLHLKGDLREHGVVHKGRLITDADLEDPDTLAWMDDNDFPQYLLRYED